MMTNILEKKAKEIKKLSGSPLAYVKVREQLRSKISGMKVGDRLAPERALSEHFKVDRTTIRRAMIDLAKEGFVARHQGRGTFVRRTFRLGVAPGRSTKLIGVILPDLEIPDFARMLKGMEEEASRSGFGIQVCSSFLDMSRQGENLARLGEQELAGMLVLPLGYDFSDTETLRLIREIHKKRTRIVLLEYLPIPEIPIVVTNRVRVGYMATEHLIALGHEKICFVTTGHHDRSGQDSMRGYRRALEDYNLKYDEKLVIEIPIDCCAEPTRQAVTKILTDNPRSVTAIATEQFSMTYGIMKALADLDKKIPDQIAVVGADAYQNPDLAHVTHTLTPSRELGLEAVKLLLREDDSENMKKNVILQPKLIIGKTCGAMR
jgi:DNA-binding LacI/PurR family transcriptional regulator